MIESPYQFRVSNPRAAPKSRQRVVCVRSRDAPHLRARTHTHMPGALLRLQQEAGEDGVTDDAIPMRPLVLVLALVDNWDFQLFHYRHLPKP
jgi:hypothetical protein